MPEDTTLFDSLQRKVNDNTLRLDDLEYLTNKKLGASSNSIYGSMMNSVNFRTGVSGWQLTPDGNLEANSGTFRGSLVANSLDIPDTTTANSFHVATNGDTWWGATSLGSAVAKILSTGIATFTSITITGGSVLTSVLSGTIGQANLNVANQGWTQTCTFTVTSALQVDWTSGSFITSDGTLYSISAGNTSSMSAKTYIYLDTSISSTTYQISSTSSDAVGAGKVLVAIAQNGTGEATFEVLGGQGGKNIDASSIVANSITANELSTSIIYAGDIEVDTAGSIRSGQTAFNTGTGWFLGNSGGDAKFSIGSTTNYLTWDGTHIVLKGSFDVGTGGLINNSSYVVASLPVPPTSIGFNVPSAFE
jgi:hypothetical protein